ncbi:hypothetical protein EON65_06830 [archaeon]|nr:MAG: hypothetical protein EON65_06830 [archaeon]
MIVSNEPGYYEQGNFGIRIENLLLLRKAHPKPLCTTSKSSSPVQKVDFLSFQPLTMIPIQKKMIVLEMLTPAEREYLNLYHSSVRELIGPLLQSEEERQWLYDSTKPL